MFILYCFCWFPLVIITILYNFKGRISKKYDFMDYALIIALSYAVWNPLVHIFTNEIFKKRLRKMFVRNETVKNDQSINIV